MQTEDLFEGIREDAYAEVAVPLPVARPFTYRIPEHAVSLVMPGSRVLVNVSGRQLTGIVVATRTSPPRDLAPGKIQSLHDCLDPLPLMSPLLLTLTRSVAGQTMSSWGEVIRTALPSGLDRVARRRVALTPTGRKAASEESLAKGSLQTASLSLLEVLLDAKGQTRTIGTLARRIGDSAICAHLYEMAQRGWVYIEDEWSSGVGGRWQDVAMPMRHIALSKALEQTERAPAQRRVIDVLWDNTQGIKVKALCEKADCGVATVKSLFVKGLIKIRRKPLDDEEQSKWSATDDGAGRFCLMDSQEQALDRILNLNEGFRSLLLHGVTGSGKTEVYLRAAKRTIEGGRKALLLVPEIGLTPLLVHRAKAVLGDDVGVMHSGMSDGERLSNWWRARNGCIRTVIGPRSAVFAPLDNVGLIIVDEEHDSAYKQDETPRYHSREVALCRARLEGASIVMGSATPSIETFFAGMGGAHEVLSMPDRVANRLLPKVDVVDMRVEWKRAGRTLLSERLEDAIEKCLGRGDQGLLLLNRRGFSASLRCRSCGEHISCPECSVSLTPHRADEILRCHYCNHKAAIPGTCPKCGSPQIQAVGHGTQQLEQVICQRFPDARLSRFDADETRRKGAHAQILSAFGRGEIDLLVGTQMLAKGHDFAGVTLVGAVGADDALGLPDFRAAERTFQLLTQMAGRAGRGETPGMVILQAYQPEHYAIKAAVEHDYYTFYEQEIEFRRRFVYPPFKALIACLCRGTNAAVVKEEAAWLAGALRAAAPSSVKVLGPAAPPLGKLRGKHRIQVLLRGHDRSGMRALLETTIEDLGKQRRLPKDLKIDVDPLNLM
ncbi:MAG: primosomal protein N' [Acidobacteriota bacterium]|nr:primosomal protein N' [Acidobacteriota bacterium]